MKYSLTIIKYVMFFLLPCIMLRSYLLKADLTLINSEAEFNTVMQSKKPTVVQFAAEWCGACKGVKQSFEEVASNEEFKDVQFVRVDVDKLPSISQKNKIAGIPTFIYVENGSPKNTDIGVKNLETFKEDMGKNIRTNFHLAANETTVTQDKTTNPITGTQTTTKRVTTEKEMPNDMVMVEEKETTTSTTPAGSTDFLGKIQAFITWLFNGIRDMFVGIIDWIKSLFAR